MYFSLTDVDDIEFQASNEINLPADNPSGCATFFIIDDGFVEGDHTVTFVIDSLSSTDGIMINTMMNTHPFTIMDNDGKESELHASIWETFKLGVQQHDTKDCIIHNYSHKRRSCFTI